MGAMSVLESPFEHVEIPAQHVTAYALRHADALADKPAFVDGGSDRTLTYGQLRAAIQKLAGGLRARGVGPGTTWALMAPNAPEYVVAMHGMSWAGATVTTLNPTYGAEEIAYQLRDASASALVTVSMFLDTARAAAKSAGIAEIFLIDEGEAPSISTLMGEGEPMLEPAAVDLETDVAALPYSSGTTGFPKGVMLTHRNLVANLAQVEGHIEMNGDDVVFAVLPFFHIYGMTVLMNLGMCSGATVVTAPRFDLVQMLELVQAKKITRLYLVPPIILALAKHPIVDQYDLSSVKQIFSGAAPLSGELADAVAKRLGCSVAQGYGMTELSPVSHAVVPGDNKPGSIGYLVRNTQARIVDPETGTDVETGERGEVWIRGPQVMKGYLGNDEATRQTIDADGWLHTGDIGLIDGDGHYFIVDRLKELIKVKGFQVAPAELEALLLEHEQIGDAAVIGVADDEAGELPKAFVVRREGAPLTEDEVKAFVADRVATYKKLHAVEFVDAIPKSASGKILRRELR